MEGAGPHMSLSVGDSLGRRRPRLHGRVWANYRGRRKLGDRHHSPNVTQRWSGMKQHIGSASPDQVGVWTRVVTSHASG